MHTTRQLMEVSSLLPVRSLGADIMEVPHIYSGDNVQVLEQPSIDGNGDTQKQTTKSTKERTEAMTREGPQNCVLYSSDLTDVQSFGKRVCNQNQASFTDAGYSEGVLSDKDLITSLNHQYRCNKEFVCDKLIGQGDFGSVMACHDWTTQKKIATKKIMKENLRPSEVTILAEVRFMPFIINFLGVTTEGSILYLHMEYFEGARQLEYFAQEGLHHLGSQFNIVQITSQLLKALDYLSHKQIIHRDLTGRNIMFKPTPMVKVIDFGLAVCAPYAQKVDDMPTGDPLYFAPEILEGETFLTTASDSWSVAINIIFLLRGSAECMDCVAQPGKEYHPLMCSHLSHCHLDLRFVLEQMLRPDWKKRPSPFKLLEQKVFQVSDRELERYPVRRPVSRRDHPHPPKSKPLVNRGTTIGICRIKDDSGFIEDETTHE